MIKDKDKLNETGVVDIADTDQNLSINDMFQQASLPSLGKQIFSVLPLSGPTGALFNFKTNKTDSNNKKVELLRADVKVIPSELIKTGLTSEVIQDIQSQYGIQSTRIIGRMLRGLSNEFENTKTLEFLNLHAIDDGLLTFSDITNAETNLFELNQKVSEIILKMNSKELRTYESCVVLPFKVAASALTLGQYVSNDDDTDDARGLFLTNINKTKFFVNPDPLSTTAYVVLKDSYNSGKSSAVFSPYSSIIVEAIDENGNYVYNIFNRFAITKSPLSTTGDEMIYKFNIA